MDEADKAPTNITFILKTLVEDGEMILSDGRRLSSNANTSSNALQIHSDFRIIILANRPGFPFSGNDFYRIIGDLFSCHVVSYPDRTSELKMLRSYGPSVSLDVLERLLSAFEDLRGLVDQGLLTYPYSTREIVAVVQHLEVFRYSLFILIL